MKAVECQFCTPEATRACTDPQCRARGYGYPPPDLTDRALLIAALTARRQEQTHQNPELLLIRSTHDGTWASDEADQILRHMRNIQARNGGRL